jgi:peroxiredoxin
MGKKVLLIILAVLVLAAMLFLFGRQRWQRSPAIQVGDAAPEFRLPSPDGAAVSLSSFRGKVVMVHFWATWCPPCVEELPALERLYRSLLDKDLVLLAISVDEGGPGVVSEFMKRNGVSFPVLLDPKRSMARRYGSFRTPETYLVDRNGIVQKKIFGAMDWTQPQAIAMITGLLEKKQL